MKKLKHFNLIILIIIEIIIFALLFFTFSKEMAIFLGAGIAYLTFGIYLFSKSKGATFACINFFVGILIIGIGIVGQLLSWGFPFGTPLIIYGVIIFFLSGGGMAIKSTDN